jgi:hypothetical protein
MKHRAWLAALFLTLHGLRAKAEMAGSNTISIDFTQPNAATTQATWMDKLNVTENGLGLDGQANASYDGWLITKPLAIGLSWRPAQAASIRLTVDPPDPAIVMANGQIEGATGAGQAFVRYSSDENNWSDWQVLQADWLKPLAKPTTQPSLNQRVFSGEVDVPGLDRIDYEKLLWKYMRLDVPWTSDEEATAKWILSNDVNFFRTHKPYVGYLEFLYEGDFLGGARITKLSAAAHWGVGGKHALPKDPTAYRDRDGPWRFNSSTPLAQPSGAVQQ